MTILRTPDEQFANLPDYPFAPHYTEIDGLRMHHVDEGPADGEIVLMLHGEPSWSYLYRKMIPPLVTAGYRAIAPDLIGFGKSDKLPNQEDYSYQKYVDWMAAWVTANELTGITLVCQDWGSLIGLRLVAEHPEWFSRVVLANGGLPTGDQKMPEAFVQWREFSRKAKRFGVGRIIQNGTVNKMPSDVVAAYNAPFPDDSYKAAARIFPSLVPIAPDDPSSAANRAAWESLRTFEKPFLTAFSDSDPITAGGDRFFQRIVPGAKGQPHTTIKGGGHFLQEDQGEALADVVIDFMKRPS